MPQWISSVNKWDINTIGHCVIYRDGDGEKALPSSALGPTSCVSHMCHGQGCRGMHGRLCSMHILLEGSGAVAGGAACAGCWLQAHVPMFCACECVWLAHLFACMHVCVDIGVLLAAHVHGTVCSVCMYLCLCVHSDMHARARVCVCMCLCMCASAHVCAHVLVWAYASVCTCACVNVCSACVHMHVSTCACVHTHAQVTLCLHTRTSVYPRSPHPPPSCHSPLAGASDGGACRGGRGQWRLAPLSAGGADGPCPSHASHSMVLMHIAYLMLPVFGSVCNRGTSLCAGASGLRPGATLRGEGGV